MMNLLETKDNSKTRINVLTSLLYYMVTRCEEISKFYFKIKNHDNIQLQLILKIIWILVGFKPWGIDIENTVMNLLVSNHKHSSTTKLWKLEMMLILLNSE